MFLSISIPYFSKLPHIPYFPIHPTAHYSTVLETLLCVAIVLDREKKALLLARLKSIDAHVDEVKNIIETLSWKGIGVIHWEIVHVDCLFLEVDLFQELPALYSDGFIEYTYSILS